MLRTLYKVNAFTANGENGNPAGVVIEADNLSAAQMQAIARQAGFSETAFITNSKTATRKLQFFTPTNEVDLCGHATIAAWSLMHKNGLAPAGEYTQETRAGMLKIVIQNNGLVFMEQAKAIFSEVASPNIVAPLLGLTIERFHQRLEPQIVSTGLRDLLLPLRDKTTLLETRPNLKAIADFSRQHTISGLHLFAPSNQNDVIASTRNFAPADGIDEEAATGTSNGALLCYLRKHNQLPDQESYRIEQGESMKQLSCIYGKFIGEIVWIGGEAILKSKMQITG